jgi:hypothetical protein
MSKSVDASVVQSSADFTAVVAQFMPDTSVFRISQDKITQYKINLGKKQKQHQKSERFMWQITHSKDSPSACLQQLRMLLHIFSRQKPRTNLPNLSQQSREWWIVGLPYDNKVYPGEITRMVGHNFELTNAKHKKCLEVSPAT